MTKKLNVAILGATGAVGQRFIQLLANHPWFQITALAASDRNAGKKYNEATNWVLRDGQMPEYVKNMTLTNCDVAEVTKNGKIDIAFSCLPGDLAQTVEPEFAKAGIGVFSKASAYRMHEDVPLMIPEVNEDQLAIIETQRKKHGWKGFIATDPNCSTTQLAIALAPLRELGLSQVHVVTMQALSGAGYPGVASLDIIDNVIPFISGEEEKIEKETEKILGKTINGRVEYSNVKVSASCHRVFASEGHMESVSVKLRDGVTEKDILDAWSRFSSEAATKKMKLPSAVDPIKYVEGNARPQHRYDVNTGNGMTVTLGRLRKDSLFSYKFTCLGHNTIRGAAGESILQAEMFKAKGII